MAEAVAAFYTIETALEGIALGGFAVTRPTVPLHLRFRKVTAPRPDLQVTDHALNASGIKIYVSGGKRPSLPAGTEDVVVLSLPSNLGPLQDYVEPLDVDYESISPSFATPLISPTDSTLNRSGHATAEIGHNLYLLGGQSSQNNGLFLTFEMIPVLNTSNRSVSLSLADISKCTDGVPEPRLHPSCASSPLLGTVFMHGGMKSNGSLLSDTWAYHVPNKRWIRLPSMVDNSASNFKSIAFTEFDGRLWALNNRTGHVSYLEFVIHEHEEGENHSGAGSIPSLPLLKGEGRWQTALPAHQTPQKPEDDSQRSVTADAPVPAASASVFPVTTGAGRQYLLFIPPDLRTSSSTPPSKSGDTTSTNHRTNIMAFQLPSQHATLASIKDKIRSKLPGTSYSSGTFEWSRCEIIEATKQDGPLAVPDGLSGWAADLVDASTVMFWGGRNKNGTWEDGGWLMSAE